MAAGRISNVVKSPFQGIADTWSGFSPDQKYGAISSGVGALGSFVNNFSNMDYDIEEQGYSFNDSEMPDYNNPYSSDYNSMIRGAKQIGNKGLVNSITSGASAGSMFGPLGAGIGAGAGALAGLLGRGARLRAARKAADKQKQLRTAYNSDFNQASMNAASDIARRERRSSILNNYFNY